jgi:hypothetical protein
MHGIRIRHGIDVVRGPKGTTVIEALNLNGGGVEIGILTMKGSLSSLPDCDQVSFVGRHCAINNVQMPKWNHSEDEEYECDQPRGTARLLYWL